MLPVRIRAGGRWVTNVPTATFGKLPRFTGTYRDFCHNFRVADSGRITSDPLRIALLEGCD
jgi:hypothetical protein